jgi:hypothetical protein
LAHLRFAEEGLSGPDDRPRPGGRASAKYDETTDRRILGCWGGHRRARWTGALISAYQPLDRRSRPRSPLSTRARIDFSIVAVEGRSRPPWRPRSGSLLSRQDLRPEGDLVGTRKARHTNAKSPGRSRGFPQPIGWRSEVALDAQTSAPLVLLARREWACLRTRCEGRDYPSRDDPETPTLVQV